MLAVMTLSLGIFGGCGGCGKQGGEPVSQVEATNVPQSSEPTEKPAVTPKATEKPMATPEPTEKPTVMCQHTGIVIRALRSSRNNAVISGIDPGICWEKSR